MNAIPKKGNGWYFKQFILKYTKESLLLICSKVASEISDACDLTRNDGAFIWMLPPPFYKYLFHLVDDK